MGSVDAITALVYPASEALLQCLFIHIKKRIEDIVEYP